jgi:hypothetical protein
VPWQTAARLAAPWEVRYEELTETSCDSSPQGMNELPIQVKADAAGQKRSTKQRCGPRQRRHTADYGIILWAGCEERNYYEWRSELDEIYHDMGGRTAMGPEMQTVWERGCTYDSERPAEVAEDTAVADGFARSVAT